MEKTKVISVEVLDSVLNLDKETGLLVWRPRHDQKGHTMKDKVIEAMARAMYRLAWSETAHWPPHNHGTHKRFTEKAMAAYVAIEAMGCSVVPNVRGQNIHHFDGKAYDISDMKPLDPEFATILEENLENLYEP
jgi:hypothetical protein